MMKQCGLILVVVLTACTLETDALGPDGDGGSHTHPWSEITDIPPGFADGVDDVGGAAGIPVGVIVMWSGNLADVPSGWALCDGAGGTPDLRDRFVYGWTNGVQPGGIGGTDTYSLTVGQLPPHTHTSNVNVSSYLAVNGTGRGVVPTNSLEGTVPYSGTSGSTGSGEEIDNRPAYYKLAFIMKL